MLIDFLSVLSDADTDLLLAINGWRAEWADYFMYAFSGKLVWIPMYAAILYVIFRNLGWKMALGCIVTVALTITFADQVCATLIRPVACRLRPANLENPISDLVQIVNGYRGGRYGFPPATPPTRSDWLSSSSTYSATACSRRSSCFGRC